MRHILRDKNPKESRLALTNKAISYPCPHYPEDKRKKRRKRPSGFHP